MTVDDEHPLHGLRDEVAPDVDPAFREGLDARLRVAHAQRQSHPPLWSRLPRAAVAVPALAVVLLLATVALVARDESAVAAIELRDATNVVVTLPTGEEIVDPADGFRLTDGAVVRVGPGGAVTIDDVTLSGGTVVTVRDGSLVTDVIGTSTTRPTQDAPPTTRATDVPPTTAAVDVPPTTTSPPVDSRPDEPAPTLPRDRPRETLPPEPEPPRDGDPPDPPPTPETTRPADDTGDPDGVTPVALASRLFVEDGRVRVVWRAEGVSVGHGHEVVVVRTTDGSDPGWPLDGGAVVGEGPHGEVVDARSDLPDGPLELRYRVIVLDEAGGVVARGAVQTISDR